MRNLKVHLIRLALLATIILLVTDVEAAIRYVDSAVASSGNGQSWATAWKAVSNITGVSAGDTVYFSGGTSGKSYSVSGWTPARGTSGSPITYAVGQDSGHTGMVTFTGTGNFVQGNLSGVTINGGVSGNRRMTISNSYSWTVYSDGNDTNGFKLLYTNLTAPIWGRGTGYEFGYNSMIAPLSMMDDSYVAHIGESAGSGYASNLFHHNYVQVWRIRTQGYGQDALKWVGNISIYNNTFISAYNASYTGTQHNDGIQTASSNVWLYNNYYEGFISYPIYNEMYGNTSRWRIFNNVINSNVADQGSIDWGAYQAMALGFSQAGTISDYIVANNTIIGGSNRRGIHFNTGVAGTVGSGCYIVNNLVYNSDTIILYKGSPTVSNNVGGTSGLAFLSVGAYPNGDFHITSGATSAISKGISPSYLTSFFTTDADNISRPLGSAWDVGAYQYSTTRATPPPPQLPTSPSILSVK